MNTVSGNEKNKPFKINLHFQQFANMLYTSSSKIKDSILNISPDFYEQRLFHKRRKMFSSK